MKRELDYFCIDGRFGGRQSWFWDPIMRMAGCAAIAASDSCISLARTFGLNRLCPYDPDQLTKRNYMPVSYTHLDVYKRQTPRCGRRSLLKS